MKQDFEKVSLGSIAEFRNGLNYSKKDFGSGLKVINVRDFKDRMYPDYASVSEINYTGSIRDADYLQNGDILFVRSNGNRELIGRSLFVQNIDQKVSHSAFTIKVRFASDQVLPQFYSYVFKTALIRRVLSAQGGGTNINNLNQMILNKLEVPLPPLPMQKKIAGILSGYDELIENNRRRIQILEEMAQTIYREWFVNFKFPGHEKVKTTDGIPEGWEVKTLEEECEIVMGQSPKSEFYNDRGEGLPFHQGVTHFGTHFPTLGKHATQGKRKAKQGDVLFSVRAPVGRINIANQEMILGRGLSAIRSRVGFQAFLLCQLKDQFKEEDSIGGGTIYKSVTKSDMQNITYLKPSVDLVAGFDKSASQLYRQLEVLTKKNANLRATRDLLLPKLISGEIEV